MARQYAPISDVDGDQTTVTADGALNVAIVTNPLPTDATIQNASIKTVLVTSAGEYIDVDHYEEYRALDVVPGHPQIFSVVLEADAIAATTQYMLIDTSNGSGRWPHPEDQAIELRCLWIQVNPDSSFVGDVCLGFLDNVDATNGDLYCLFTWHLEKKADSIVAVYDQGWNPIRCHTDYHFGPVTANDVKWQTDAAIAGPDGNTYGSGNKDIVLDVTLSAGTVDISIMLGYLLHGHI